MVAEHEFYRGHGKFWTAVMAGDSKDFLKAIPTWNGKSETFDDFVDRCWLWILGTSKQIVDFSELDSFSPSRRAREHVKDTGETAVLDKLRT